MQGAKEVKNVQDIKRATKCLLLTMWLLAGPAQAASEFEDSVPVDLARVLLNPGNATDVGLYQDIMETFPDIDLPDNFTVLGSLDQGVIQRVVLQTALERQAADTLLSEALTEAGWVEIQQPESAAAPRGFVPAGGRQAYGIIRSFCHDDFGNMTLNVLASDDGNLASLMRTNTRMFGGMQPGCEQQAQRMIQSFGIRSMGVGGVSEHMPTLQMPEEAGGPGIARMGIISGGGSSNDWETRGNLVIDWAIGMLYGHFAVQLGEQGWTEDSAWTGNITAGGNWTKSPEDDLELVAILSIVETAEENFELKLRVLERGRQTGTRTGVVNTIIGR